MENKDLPFPANSRLISYVRDSGGNQQDLSIPQQEAKIGEWCAAHGYALVRVFKDAARSGTTTAGRDAFLEMFAYLSRGAEVAGVVVWEYARLSRDYDDAQFYLADLRRQGYGVYSISDQVPAGLDGRLLESIAAWKNAKYSADLSRNVRRGKAYVVTAYHGWPHNRIPPGFRKSYFEAGHRRDGSPHMIARLEPDPATAPVVQQAFSMRAQGASYTEIREAVSLFAKNSTYYYIYRNKLYIGVYDRDGIYIDDYCPAIIDADTWDQVQRINDAQFHPRRIHSPFVLSGLLKCSLCGSPMTGTYKANHIVGYYRCPRKPYKMAGGDCPAGSIRKDAIERRVVQLLLDVLDKPQILADIQSEMRRQAETGDLPRLAAIAGKRADLVSNERAISNITAAIRAAGHSPALIADLADLENKRADLLQSIAELEGKAPSLAAPVDMFATANSLRPALQSASGRDLQKLCRLVVTSIRARSIGGMIVGDVTIKIGDVTQTVAL